MDCSHVNWLWIFVIILILFRLSFWWHPFTTEDLLVSKWFFRWIVSNLFQRRSKLIHILAGLRGEYISSKCWFWGELFLHVLFFLLCGILLFSSYFFTLFPPFHFLRQYTQIVLLFWNLRYSSYHLSYVGLQKVYLSVLNRRQVIKSANFVILIHKVISADCRLSYKKKITLM